MRALAEASDRIIRSAFDVYLGGKSLIYHKQDCRLTDLSALFFLHVTPVDETDLPEGRALWVRQSGFSCIELRDRQEYLYGKD